MSTENQSDFMEQSDPVGFNEAAWDRLAVSGDRYYQAATTQQITAARNGDWKIRITPQKPVPRQWLEPVVGRHVLCLAGGGGQQAPILAAAGAHVTVFDLSEQQLVRDRLIAEREKLEIETVAGDMAELSCFPNQEFDLIVNPCSVCYCPDVKPIWAECSRVLKTGGILITGFINPLYYLFDAMEMDKNRLIVRHKIPYSDLDLSPEERERVLGDSRPREFGHTLTDLIGQQLDAGLVLRGFYEDGWALNDKLSSYIDVFIATCAVKL